MGERQRHRTTIAGTSDIICVFVRGDLHLQESRYVVRGPDMMPLSMAHLIKPISELLYPPSPILLAPSLTHLEEIT